MEKLGVEKQQLKSELQEKYNDLKQKKVELTKTGAACPVVDTQINDIKEKIESLDSE